MALAIVDEHPFARGEDGRLKSRIATLFTSRRILVTLPGVHATQRLAYVERVNRERAEQGQQPLSWDEECREWEGAVDLIIDDDAILIRPDPANMPLAFTADEMLQDLVSKRKIRFLFARDALVRQAMRERGEYWRIAPLPQSPQETARMIRAARIAIGGRSIYYYNMFAGTRYLTFQEFQALAENADDNELWAHLKEIHRYSGGKNRLGCPELDFFGVEGRFSHNDFDACDFSKDDPSGAKRIHAELVERFRRAVAPELQEDNPDDPEWRKLMLLSLVARKDETVAEEVLEGLNPEFLMQIQWLPGARIEEGELIFDPLFDEAERDPGDAALRDICDEKVKGFISNYVREFFGNLEYVNVGRVAPTLRRRATVAPHRAYIAEIKRRDNPDPAVRIIRFQKWDIHEHIDEDKDLLRSIMEAADYTDYILDRRLGCWQLGMPLPPRITTCRLTVPYTGRNPNYHGTRIWSTYFERDYIKGVATDKVPAACLRDPRFAVAFARLLGHVAAPNMIVGRTSLAGEMIFDGGDEILVRDDAGMPKDIVVADHAGTFNDYTSDLSRFAAEYAKPVLKRLRFLPDQCAFAEAYLSGFEEKFHRIQDEYRKQRRPFDALFNHIKQDMGSFAWRWKQVLARIDGTEVPALAERIRLQLAARIMGL